MDWQLQDAKNRFSAVVQRAQTQGPQFVTLRGHRSAVVLSYREFERLSAGKPNLADFLLAGPSWSDVFVEEVNQRDRTPARPSEF